MQTIIAQPGNHAHPGPDQAARQRANRLAKATTGQIEKALTRRALAGPSPAAPRRTPAGRGTEQAAGQAGMAQARPGVTRMAVL